MSDEIFLPPHKGDRATGCITLKLRASRANPPDPAEPVKTLTARIEIVRTGNSAVKVLTWLPAEGDQPERFGGSVGIRMKGPLVGSTEKAWVVAALDGQHDGRMADGEGAALTALLDVALRQASGNTICCAG